MKMNTYEEYIQEERLWIAGELTNFSKDTKVTLAIAKSLRRKKYFKRKWSQDYIWYCKEYVFDHHWSTKLSSFIFEIKYRLEKLEHRLFDIANKKRNEMEKKLVTETKMAKESSRKKVRKQLLPLQ